MHVPKRYFLGIDLGSSSVKTCLFDAERGVSLACTSVPKTEQPITSREPGWAEQSPEMWWRNFETGFFTVLNESGIDPRKIGAIGIAYQMHGLVLIDNNGSVLRDSIIWCDGRATNIGRNAATNIGLNTCLNTVLNYPGNFTASKLRWVRENEPELYHRIRWMLLPGDFLAHRLTGEATTTAGGLSEAVLWNFKDNCVSREVLSEFDIDPAILPRVVPMIGVQATVSDQVADRLGLARRVPVTYRTGDQSNNAFSLGVLDPGDVAATAGTSGVLFAVTDLDIADPASRINTFLHVNNDHSRKRNGVLACVNGTGKLYSWLRSILSSGETSFGYGEMNELAARSAPGARGLHFFPFGNGAERILEDCFVRAHMTQIDFNQHGRSEIIRAGLEGIAYALRLGFDILGECGLRPQSIRAGSANLFLSPIFVDIFASVLATPVQIYQTNGAEGAARGAALGASFYPDEQHAFRNLAKERIYTPCQQSVSEYEERFLRWKEELQNRFLSDSQH